MLICYSDSYHLTCFSGIIELEMLLASSSERREQAMLLPLYERERNRRAHHVDTTKVD